MSVFILSESYFYEFMNCFFFSLMSLLNCITVFIMTLRLCQYCSKDIQSQAEVFKEEGGPPQGGLREPQGMKKKTLLD